MSEKVINAGDEIDSYCTSCRLVLAHSVVALVGDKVEKVECKTCGKQHKYRPRAPKSEKTAVEKLSSSEDAPKKEAAPKKKAAAAKTKPAKTTKTRKAKDAESGWEEALAGRDIAGAKDYAISGEYEERDVLNHKTFGMGVVVKVLAEGKMQVRFKDGSKLLVHGKK